jgi:hypothetical protein
MTQLTENKQPAPFRIGYSSTFLPTTNTSNHFATPRGKCKFSSPPITTDVVLVPTLRPAVKWNALQRASEDRVRHNQ